MQVPYPIANDKSTQAVDRMDKDKEKSLRQGILLIRVLPIDPISRLTSSGGTHKISSGSVKPQSSRVASTLI